MGRRGANIGFPSQYQPSHLALTSTRNWPKSLSIFSNHVKRKTLMLEIERIGRGDQCMGEKEGWAALLDYLSSDGSSANAPQACASLVYCTCTWPSACSHFREFSTADNVQRAGQCALACSGRANEQVTKILFTADQLHCWKEHTGQVSKHNSLDFTARNL